jgi:outer membrane protein assembly factor BamB
MEDTMVKRILVSLLLLAPLCATVAGVHTIAYALGDQIWGMDVRTGQKQRLFDPPGAPGAGIGHPAWSRDGKKIAVALGDVWLIDVATRKSRILARADGRSYLGTPVWSVDGRYVYVARNLRDDVDADGGLWRIAVRTGQAQVFIRPEDVDWPFHTAPQVSADGRYLVSSGLLDGDSSFYAIDLSANTRLKLPYQQLFHHVRCYTFDASRSVLYFGVDADTDMPIAKGPGGVWRWDLATNRCTPWGFKGQTIGALAMNPTGTRLLVAVWRNAHGTRRESLYAFTPSGKQLADLPLVGEIREIAWLDHHTFVAVNQPNDDIHETNIICYNVHTDTSRVLVKGGYGVAVADTRAR